MADEEAAEVLRQRPETLKEADLARTSTQPYREGQAEG